MSRGNAFRRLDSATSAVNQDNLAKGSERTPLLNSVGMSEALVNKNVSEMQTGVSWGVAAFLLVNTALGAGMLNYPYAYNQIGGIMAAALMQIVLLIFITSTMFILVYCADFNQDSTYHDVLLSMCGKRAQQISAISILLTCYGINITFLVIIGDQYDRIFNSLLAEYLDQFWFLDRKFTISMTAILFIWPMCYAKRLDFLRHASILGMFSMLYVTFLTVYEHYKLDEETIVSSLSQHKAETSPQANLVNNTLPQSPSPQPASLTTAATFNQQIQWFESLAIVPVLCFAYQTHEVIVPVYACMKQRHIGHFMKASIFGLVILFLLYNLVGAFGYLTFGENVGPDIMSLYDAKDPIVVVGVVALVIKFITTYPPLMFCGRGALDGLYGEIFKMNVDEFNATEKIRRIIITTIWFLSTVALAVSVPDIALTLKLLGSMAAINVFVFPGMCLVSLTRRLRRARSSLLIDGVNDPINQQRAKDYYLISGSYFGVMKKNAQRVESLSNQHSLASGSNRQFAATFASLLDFESNASSRFGEYSNINGNGGSVSQQPSQRINGYGTAQFRQQKRQEEFERLITNGSISAQDQCVPKRRTINESYDDYSSCDDQNSDERSDLINSLMMNNNGQINSKSYLTTNQGRVIGSDLNISASNNYNKEVSLDGSARLANNSIHRHANQQSLLNSWKNGSTNGSVIDRLGSTIAPTVVAQIGISKFVATGLYLFSALLIVFGAFIFVLELVSVFNIL